MPSLGDLFILLVALALFVVGGLVVSQQFRGEVLGDYHFGYDSVSDSTDLTASGNVSLSTQRTSVKGTANLTVAFDVGSGVDNVSLGSCFVGNLSGGSPKTFTGIDGACVDVPAVVWYELNSSSVVNDTSLVYYRYYNCPHDEKTCDSLDVSFGLTAMLFHPLSGVFLLLMALVVVVALMGFS